MISEHGLGIGMMKKRLEELLDRKNILESELKLIDLSITNLHESIEALDHDRRLSEV